LIFFILFVLKKYLIFGTLPKIKKKKNS